jgi:hypothetical protein
MSFEQFRQSITSTLGAAKAKDDLAAYGNGCAGLVLRATLPG